MQKLKIFFNNNDIRRVPMNSNDYNSLKTQISELFSLDETSFTIKYKDDEGDLITLCNDQDLKEALSNCQNNLLRIFINSKNQRRKMRKCKRTKKINEETVKNNDLMPIIEETLDFIQPFCGQIENLIQNVLYGGDLEENFSSLYSNVQEKLQNNTISENNNNNPPKVVHGAFCDKCDNKIQGIRWKCFECPDFDFCDSCYQICSTKEDFKNHKKEHVFGKIEDPNNHSSFRQEKEKYFEMKQLEKIQKENEEKERQEKERQEKERQEKERQEKERQEKERQEKERQEKERQEKERQEKEKNGNIVYPFEQKLKDLEEMGFVDRKRNIALLIKFRGDIQSAIQQLLN